MGSVMMRAARRLYLGILPTARVMAKGRLIRLPLTKQEVRARVMTKFREGEAGAVQMQGKQRSEACRILLKLHLDPPAIKLAYSGLGGDGPARATPNSVICTTRFKYVGKDAPGVLRPTPRQACNRNQIDNFEHLAERVGLR